MIKISLIVPNYNKEKYVIECLQSCLDQTNKDIEIIFVDNESTDSSLQKVKEFKEKYNYNFIIDTAKNIYPMCWDECIDAAQKYVTGDYYTIIASDDLIDPSYIENCVLHIKDKSPLIFQSPLLWFKDGKKIHQTHYRFSDLSDFKNQLLRSCCVNTPTVVYKKELLNDLSIRTNPIEYSGASDYELYCQLADRNVIIESSEKFLGYFYRINEQQATWLMHNQNIDYASLIQKKWNDKWREERTRHD